MAVKFQSDDYFQEVNAAIQSNDEVAKAAKGHTVAIQVITTDMPGVGEMKTYLKITNGVPEAGKGEVADPSATISQDYPTAVELDKGNLNPQTAFMEGKIRIKGNLMKLLTLTKFMQSLGPATEHIEREY
jgi:putative sterol carrier protein